MDGLANQATQMERLQMNKLIFELIQLQNGNRGLLWTEEDKEEFAELIVRECIAMCKTSVGNADYNTGRLHCLENIKEHFGVK
jgi:hypothetical protein